MAFDAAQFNGYKVASLFWDGELLFDCSLYRPAQREVRQPTVRMTPSSNPPDTILAEQLGKVIDVWRLE